MQKKAKTEWKNIYLAYKHHDSWARFNAIRVECGSELGQWTSYRSENKALDANLVVLTFCLQKNWAETVTGSVLLSEQFFNWMNIEWLQMMQLKWSKMQTNWNDSFRKCTQCKTKHLTGMNVNCESIATVVSAAHHIKIC